MNEGLFNIICCPYCKNKLNKNERVFSCRDCGINFEFNERFISFLSQDGIGNIPSVYTREFLKRYPRFYYFIADLFGPMWWTGLGPKKFFKRFCVHINCVLINLGSGPKMLGNNVSNIDLYPYRGVSLVADILQLPLRDNSVDCIVCDTVIEHVNSPEVLIKEIQRVLVPGGKAYITAPFLYPFHDSPSDFMRWTKAGFVKLLGENFKLLRSGVRAGPLSVLAVYCCYLSALLFSFGSRRIFDLVLNLSIFIFFPLKLLDIVLSKLPFAEDLSAILYYVIEKK